MLEKLKCNLCDVRKFGFCRFYVVLHVAWPKFTIFYHICSELFWLLSQLFFKCMFCKHGSLHKRPDSFLFGEEYQNCVDETKCNSQFLAMVIQMKDLFFFFDIMQNKFHTKHIPHIMHQPWQSLCFCMNYGLQLWIGDDMWCMKLTSHIKWVFFHKFDYMGWNSMEIIQHS